MDTKNIYLDYNATTPLDPAVIISITESLRDLWGNPSSKYEIGYKAKEAINIARKQVANMIKAKENEILFTSGGTESNNMLLNSLAKSYCEKFGKIPHFITSVFEHDSILKVMRNLEKDGNIRLTEINISPLNGQVDIEQLTQSLDSDTYLVSIMLANNETGIIQPLKKISEILKIHSEINPDQPRILLHSDAAQAYGKIPVFADELQVDFLTIVGHKYYGPRIGALYVRDLGDSNQIHTKIQPLMFGGGQENNLRSGTENTPMIVGLGKASELVSENIENYQAHMMDICQYLEKCLLQTFGKYRCRILSKYSSNDDSMTVAQSFEYRLPNTCCVSLTGINQYVTGPEVLNKCNYLQSSVGAACHSRDISEFNASEYTGSEILQKCGFTRQQCRTAVRLSVGRTTTRQDIDVAIGDLNQALLKCISHSGDDCNKVLSKGSSTTVTDKYRGFSEI